MTTLEPYLSSSYNRLDFISEEGMFTIKNDTIYQVYKENENNIKFINNYVNQYDVVMDGSNDVYVKKYCLPYNYIELNNSVFTYMLNKNDDIKLVFVGKHKENKFASFFKKNDNKCDNKYGTLEISDFYFETNNKNNNADYLKNKINEFLSLLN